MATHRIYRGLLNRVILFLKEAGYTYDSHVVNSDNSASEEQIKTFIDSLELRVNGETINAKSHQVSAITAAIMQQRMTALCPTASGKSLINYCLVRWYQELLDKPKILIIVPTTQLVEQFYSDMADYSSHDETWNAEDSAHRIYAGKDKTTDKPVIISTWQSLAKQPKSYFKNINMFIIDECHIAKAASLKTILTKLDNCHNRFGTTGTLDECEVHHLVLEGLIGPVNKIITTKELMDAGEIAALNIKCVELQYPAEDCESVRTMSYQEEIDFLCNNKARNVFIKKLADHVPGNNLILFRYVEKHGKPLYEELQKYSDRPIFFIHGGVKGEDREEIRKLVNSRKDAIIVASYGTTQLGVNIPNLNNIIFASPGKSKIMVLQSIGRGLRKSETKCDATLYDIADILTSKRGKKNYTQNHYISRLKLYLKERFNIKTDRVSVS